MKSELLLVVSLCATILLSVLAAADPIQNPFGATVTIGNPGTTTTTTTTPIPVSNPSSITFQIIARDSTGQSQQVNVSLYDTVNHNFLNSSQFVGLGNVFSSTSNADFELNYDNQNLDVMVNGLNVTTLGNTPSSITVENSNPQITNFTLYRAYHVELPWNATLFNTITLKINLAGLSNVNYNNIGVYRCGNYNIITNICSDSGGWQAQTISVDQTHQIVSLNINHFSVYAVGSGSVSQSSISTTTTTTSQTATTSTSSAPASSSSSSNLGSSVGGSSSGGGGGGGAAYIPQVTTTTSLPTTTTTVLIVKRNDTSTTSTSEATSFPISGLIGLTNQFSPVLIVAVIIVASVVAIPFIKNNHSFSGLNPFRKSYRTFPTRKIKKGKKNTELKLSL
jgi:hypothetical protein